MIAVVVSRADLASEHVGECLLDLADWEECRDEDRPHAEGGGIYYRTEGFELREFDDLHLYLEGAADAFNDPDLLAFASRHSGATGPLLTAHPTGNFGPAEYGGRDGELARTAPGALGRVLRAFEGHAPDGYDTGLECTHHGPSRVGCPSLFVELGSSEAEWSHPAGARAVARSILALRGVDPDRERTLVGFGGGHYVPRFERIVRETDWAVGHVAADWALDALDDSPDVIGQAFERSGAVRAVLDGSYPDLEETVADLGYEVVSETWVRETTGVPLSLVARIEDALGPVDDGVRFGAPAREREDVTFETATIPTELLAAANGIDRERVLETVARHALAYATTDGATKVTGPVALTASAARDRLVDALAGVLRRKYDEVERCKGAVVAREEAFEPERARALGVEEGPAFGKLADGNPVEIDGKTVAPGDVQVARTRRFPVADFIS